MRRLKLSRKKGEITDIVIFIITIFFLAVSFVAVGMVMQKLKFVVESTPLNSTEVGQTVIHSYDVITFESIPNAYVFLFAFLIIAQLITSFLVKYHPIFIVFFICIAGFSIFVSFVLANAYSAFVNADVLNDVAYRYSSMNYIWQHIGIIMSAVSALSLIILMARLPGSSSQI